MIIGVIKEIMRGERRVAATPETAAKFVQGGATVLVERNAGAGSFFSDEDFIAAGALIANDPAEIFTRANLILKVKEPQFNAEKQRHEVEMMHEGQTLITFIHPASPVNHEMVKQLAAKGVTSLTLDGVPRISRAQSMDALTSMSTCAGYKGMIMAADSLAKFVPQIFCAVGMIPPIQVLVIGAGVGGLQAAATAKRLGAVVYAADIRPDAVEQAKSLGAKIIDLGVPADSAVGAGGYALALPQPLLQQERSALGEILGNMDIVFCSALVPSKVAPVLITEEMVKTMKPGSVLVDISIDQGGNCAITEPGEVAIKHGVVLNGIKNIPGLLPTSSTWMYAQNIYHFAQLLIRDGQIRIDRDDEIVAGTLTTIDGKVVHAGALEAMGMAQ